MSRHRMPVRLTPTAARRALVAKVTSTALGKVTVSLTVMIGQREWHLGTSHEWAPADHETVLYPLLLAFADGAQIELIITRDTASRGLAYHGTAAQYRRHEIAMPRTAPK